MTNPASFYGPVVLGNGTSLRPGDEGFDEAWDKAQPFVPSVLTTDDWVVLPDGCTFIFHPNGEVEIVT